MDERKFAIAQAVAKQIETEQGLTANRLNWNLTFQGFMLASYALVATAETSDPNRDWVHAIIIAAGIIVSLATLLGVHASRMQSSDLKVFWNESGLDETGHPRPFSRKEISMIGRLPPYLICGVVAIMWLALISIDLVFDLLP